MGAKKSFYLFKDSLNILDDLSDKKAGKLFKAIRNYQENNLFPDEFWLKIALKPFVNQFVRDNKQYDATCKKNKNNGAKGGRPRNPVGFKENQKNQSVNLKPKKPDKDIDKGKDKNNGNDNDSELAIKKTPTILEVENYFLKKLLTPNLKLKNSSNIMKHWGGKIKDKKLRTGKVLLNYGF